MSELINEYNNVLNWFKVEHPALFEKYGRNIDIPHEIGGGATVNNNYKISQEEFERIFRVVNTYYTQKDINEFDTVEFQYAPDIREDKNGEGAILNNAVMWLSPIVKQINRQSGKVVITFVKPGVNTIGVHNVSDELKNEAKRLVESHHIPFYP